MDVVQTPKSKPLRLWRALRSTRRWGRVVANTLPSWLINLIGSLVLWLFIGLFFKARAHSGTDPFPTPFEYFLTTVNGMLAANLGGLVGVTVAVKASRVEASASLFQIFAAIVYSSIVVVAWIVWAERGFAEGLPDIVPVIPEMCRTGLGIVLGVFALALGVKAPK